MKKLSLLAALTLSSFAAFAADYYVVTAVPGKTVNASAIQVAISQTTLPGAVVGTAYTYDFNQHLSVTGDPGYSGYGVKWTVGSGSLPAGLTLNASTGVVSGTPTTESTVAFTLVATYKTKTGTQSFQIPVQLAVSLSLASATLPQGYVGQAYSYNLAPLLTVSGDSSYTGSGVTWTSLGSTLPAGLSLTSDGKISGTPTVSTSGSVTAQATYRGVSSSHAYTVSTASNLVLQAGGYRTWSDGTYASSCAAYLAGDSTHQYAGATGDGTYRLSISGSTFDAYCDMTQDGGGWVRIGTFNGTSDTTLAATYRNLIPYTQAKISLNGTSTSKLISCHATPKTGFAADSSAGNNCTKADSDGYSYSIRVQQVGSGTGGNYGLYSQGSLLGTGGCNWSPSTTKVWGRHYTGTGGVCTNYGTGQTYSSPNGWGANMNWLLVR